ncbi:hypothetical protein D3C80_756420 [compost metagenome]
MPRKHVAYLGLVRVGYPFEEIHAGHENARSAKAALQGVMTAKGLLQVAQSVVVGQGLDGLDTPLVPLYREHQAGTHGDSVHQHRAGTANTVFASDMDTGGTEVVAQEVAELGPRFSQRFAGAAIEFQANRKGLVGSYTHVQTPSIS